MANNLKKSPPKMNNLLTRSLSAVVYAAIVLSAILFSSYLLWGFVLLITGLAAREYFGLVLKHTNARIPVLLQVVFSLIPAFLFGLVKIEVIDEKFLWLILGIPVLQFIPSLSPKKQNLFGFGTTVAGLVMIVLPLLLMLELGIPGHDFTSKYLLAAIVLIWINDTFAYLTGSLIGKHKLAKAISPKKTWEGLAGGFVFTLAAVYAFSVLYPVPALPYWLGLAVVASVTATLGDLAESLFKRHFGIKDSGNIMPGHGGILDRIDSILFVIPAFVLYLKIFALL